MMRVQQVRFGDDRLEPRLDLVGGRCDREGMRFETRKICVSTAMRGIPKATLRTTLAVFAPTPGNT